MRQLSSYIYKHDVLPVGKPELDKHFVPTCERDTRCFTSMRTQLITFISHSVFIHISRRSRTRPQTFYTIDHGEITCRDMVLLFHMLQGFGICISVSGHLKTSFKVSIVQKCKSLSDNSYQTRKILYSNKMMSN